MTNENSDTATSIPLPIIQKLKKVKECLEKNYEIWRKRIENCEGEGKELLKIRFIEQIKTDPEQIPEKIKEIDKLLYSHRNTN